MLDALQPRARLGLLLVATLALGAAARPARANCFVDERAGERRLCCSSLDHEVTCQPDPEGPPPAPEMRCERYDDNGDEVECCERLDGAGPRVCGRPGWRDLRCGDPDDPRCFDWAGPGAWDHARQHRWNLELGIGASAGVLAAREAVGGGRTYAAGAAIEARLRSMYRWEPRTATGRLLAVLPMVITGNELGLEIRGGVLASRSGLGGAGVYAAVRLLGTFSFGRWRVPFPLAFLPELGVRKVAGHAAELTWAAHLPISVMVRRRLGLELELGAGPAYGYTAGLGLVVR